MKRITPRLAAWFLVGAVAVFIFVAVFVKGREEQASDDQKVFIDPNSQSYVMISSRWYVEKDGSGFTVYPNYNPTGIPASVPVCKIAISKFPGIPGGNLGDWITQNLHADPTMDVTENSRKPIMVDGRSGIEWRGVLNGTAAELVYVTAANGEIFEIVPSMLSASAGGTGDTCEDNLRTLIANVRFNQ
jgi:hypothetical protein